jgi:hypothetical protein
MKIQSQHKCHQSCDDLLRYLLIKAAPVMLKVKPAVLVRITNCCRVREFMRYDLFCVYQQYILDTLQMDYLVMRNTGEDMQVMFYDAEVLEGVLGGAGVRDFLKDQGYDCALNTGEYLEQLRLRFSLSNDFPHEIGVFLGYPLHDVKGFIAGRNDSIAGIRGLWKVFEEPREALRLMWMYRFAEDIVKIALDEYKNIRDCVHHLKCVVE